MSRCFPYPPPGYERSPITHDVTLIESIKREDGKKAKKEKRKDKKHEKKEKEKIGENREVEDKKHGHKRRHKDQRSQEHEKGVDHHKRSEYETEQIEKSNLTQENGHPVASHQNLSNSTDSTYNSNNKRQKHNSGNLIRIRLPLQRHNDPEVVTPSLEQPCFSRKIDGYVQETSTLHGSTSVTYKESLVEKSCFMPPVSKINAYVQDKCSTSNTHKDSVIEQPAREVPCLTSRASKIIDEKRKTAHLPRLHPLELQFRNLIEDWAPLSLQMQHTTDLDDQNWLFKTKQNRKCGAERSLVTSSGLIGANSTSWPRSYYLPEADIYALPYTIPF